jgi:hypothetical protein
MEACRIKDCKNRVPASQKCWECGKHFCSEHLTMHPRCQKWKLCPNRECWILHEPWCETYLPYLGPLKIEKALGKGRESVYVWYAKTDFELAKRKRIRSWPCKIGCTKGEPSARIIAQGAFTAFHSEPIVALVFRTKDAQRLETLIHAALDYRGKRIKNARGTEWFKTNPREIERLYQALGQVMVSHAVR